MELSSGIYRGIIDLNNRLMFALLGGVHTMLYQLRRITTHVLMTIMSNFGFYKRTSVSPFNDCTAIYTHTW